MRDPLLELDSPSEFYRGAPPDAALAVFPPAFRRRIGTSPLLGFCAPSTLALRVPPSSAATGANADRGRRGVPLPHRCRPRAFSAPRRFEPRRPARPGLPRVRSRQRLPRNCAALFHAANVLGVRPTEPSPPGEPCRLPAAVASLRVRARPCRGAAARARREGFRCALDPEPRRGHEAHDRDRRDGTQLPALTGDRRTRRELPRARTRRPHTSPDSPTTRPDRPLRSLAPSESPFSRPPARRAGACAPSRRTSTGPLLSWDYALLEPSPPRPRVRSIAR
jgi:hypothetical protein